MNSREILFRLCSALKVALFWPMKGEEPKPFTYCKVQRDWKLRDEDKKFIAINIKIPGIQDMTSLKQTDIRVKYKRTSKR